jgi:plastocyanin/multisubunit Na+/H+ antiporter MnhG subunit
LHSARRHPAAATGKLPAVPVLAVDITAFHVLGVCLALWAVVLTAIGVRRHDFPGKGSGTTIVIAISALLVASTVAAAIGTAKSAPKGSEQAGKVNKAGREGTGQPSQGGGLAPGTGANAGQEPGGNSSQDTQPAPAPAGTVKTLLLSADPTGQLRFDKNTLAAPAGGVRITMQNPAPVPHNVSLEGPGGLDEHGPTVQKGGASEVQATLKAGTYTYYCSVPGHRQAGMEGTLTVK